MKLLLALMATLALCQAEKMRFDNHKLYRIVPKTPQMTETLRNMEELAFATGYTFFTGVGKVNGSVDILVPPKQAEEFETILDHIDVESTLLNENIQNSIDNEGFRPESKSGSFGWTSYHTLDEINAWMRDLAFNYDDKVQIFIAGQTTERRDILGVKIHIPSNQTKKAVFLEANIHAREWVTSATATYILHELIVSQDWEVRQLVELYDWYIFPVVNPDGFVHSHVNNRMWRKTRTRYTTICYGADPNRNWPYQWMQGGASNQPCTDTYAGPEPLSEPSVNTLSQFIDSVGDQLIAYLSLHSFSQMLLLPYGHTTAPLDNYPEMLEIGLQAVRELQAKYGTRYVVGNVAETIYVATGSSADWVKHKYGVPIVYTYELRDTGAHGFLLPADQIIPTADETLISIKSIFRQYRERHSEP